MQKMALLVISGNVIDFGLTDIGQFAKWSIYIVATMRMCKFEFSKTL